MQFRGSVRNHQNVNEESIKCKASRFDAAPTYTVKSPVDNHGDRNAYDSLEMQSKSGNVTHSVLIPLSPTFLLPFCVVSRPKHKTKSTKANKIKNFWNFHYQQISGIGDERKSEIKQVLNRKFYFVDEFEVSFGIHIRCVCRPGAIRKVEIFIWTTVNKH